MFNLLKKFLGSISILLLLLSCDDNLLPYYDTQEPGEIVIKGYSVSDSLEIIIDEAPIIINEKSVFLKYMDKDYEFVYYNDKAKNVDIVINETRQILKSYSFTNNKPFDTLSFFYSNVTYIDNVLRFKKSVLNEQGSTGYKFIFPSLNRYSKTNYTGPLDGIIRNTSGTVLGIVENITSDNFSSFTAFPFSSPPIIKMELVKHGTTESYIPGTQIMVTMVMQANKSRMIVLEEKQDESGSFSGVEGIVDLSDYFELETE